MKELGPSSKSQTVAKDRIIQVMRGAVGDQRGLKRRLRLCRGRRGVRLDWKAWWDAVRKMTHCGVRTCLQLCEGAVLI